MKGLDQPGPSGTAPGSRRSVQRSIFFSAIERYGNLVVFLVTTAVLARLLTPAEFGIYAVVNAVTAVVVASFQEFGGANYLVQKRELSRASVQTAFTVTFGISALTGLVLLALSGVLSQLFDQESLQKGIAVSALSFLLAPFSGTITGLFRRDMAFGKLAICNLVSGVVAAAVSIALAMSSFGFMAPVWGGVAGNVVLTIMLLRQHRDFGVFRPSVADFRDVVRFGLYSSGISIINVLYNLSPQLFLAKILDFTSVGLYSRATSITQVFDRLVVQVLNPIIMPALVSRSRDAAGLRSAYLDAVELLSVVQWPFLLFIAIMAHPIILILLGQNWLEIVPLVRFLCVANLALFGACLSYPTLVATGSVRDALTSSLISLPPSLLVILCAAFFGAEAVAASALLTLPFQAAVALYFIGRRLALEPKHLSRALLKSGVVTAMSASGMMVCAALIEARIVPSFVGLIVACGVAALCWGLGLMLTGHPLLHHLYRAAGGVVVIAPWLRLRRL
ncbi:MULTISPECIES: oligosaccharide flippase family protein [Bradyrhizobium]|uniref:oligosaccharide flippase family protein n=1 Tax=Bradyrhizobium elkanii TaxID=29448 RepID=UPI0004182341|nr:oligosaccharide flippase family protein [Bradyrhizobium elkanii]